jgi:hypothetical protein
MVGQVSCLEALQIFDCLSQGHGCLLLALCPEPVCDKPTDDRQWLTQHLNSHYEYAGAGMHMQVQCTWRCRQEGSRASVEVCTFICAQRRLVQQLSAVT